jgi:hypothetical protein
VDKTCCDSGILLSIPPYQGGSIGIGQTYQCFLRWPRSLMFFCLFSLDCTVLVGKTAVGVLKNVIQGEHERQPSLRGRHSAEIHSDVHGLRWIEFYFLHFTTL